MSFPFDAFLGLVDSVIDLIRARSLTRRQWFEDIIEPLFREFEPVADDYFALFRHAGVLVKNGAAPGLAEAIGEIRSRREAMMLARAKVISLARAIDGGARDPKIRAFGSKLVGFFFSSKVPYGMRSLSRGQELVEICDYVLEDKTDHSQLQQFIDGTLKQLEQSWMAVVQAYATARVHCLRPGAIPGSRALPPN